MIKFGFWEYFLIQLILLIAIWLLNDYYGTLTSGIWGSLCLFILVVSLLVEWIEPSRVPKVYFWFMFAAVLASVVSAAIYLSFFGELDWLEI